MHGTYRGVNVERHYVNRFHVIGRYFADLATRQPDRRCSILTYDIGVVGYPTRCDIQDMLGIVDPVIAHQPAPATMGGDCRDTRSIPPLFVWPASDVRDLYRATAAGAADWPHPSELEACARAESSSSRRGWRIRSTTKPAISRISNGNV